MQILFYILFSVTPLILWPKTSELFEFNKMIFVYAMTVIIAAAWLSRCLAAKKFIFRRTILDIPLLVFLGSQFLSTLFSIDPRTSLLGYYSRFNGGLMSTVCYLLLFWAFVSNMDRKKTLYAIRFTLYASVLVCIIAFLEHFNINITCALMGQGFESCWVQDVQNRVFSTLGQPNWLATYIVALMPLAWCNLISNFQFPISNKFSKFKFSISLALSILLFITLLFTKSRSGLLGFAFADIIFWGFILRKYKKQFLVHAIVLNSLFVVLFFTISSPFTVHRSPITSPTGPALETGGTESGKIRKIVWKGALQIWRHYPITGSGVETFAYSYYQFRPVEHNLVSEWDFLYNKAHNEYLNMAATTGTFGLLSYLYLIGVIFFVFFRKFDLLSVSLGAGFAGLLIANFFGFSTVATQLEFFLFPAFAITLGISGQRIGNSLKQKLNNNQKASIVLALSAVTYILSAICKYWYADTLFAKGKFFNDQGSFAKGQTLLQNAVKYSSAEPIFHSELANSYTGTALALHGLKKDDQAAPFIDLAVSESIKATALSPAYINLLRSRAGVLLKLAAINPKYLGFAKETLIAASQKAPTDVKLLYNLALVYIRTGEVEESIRLLEKAIEMKPNYQEAKDLLNMVHKTR